VTLHREERDMARLTAQHDVDSIPQLLEMRAAATSDGVALRFPSSGGEQTITWSELLSEVLRVAAGLVALGVEHGDRVALLCSTRPEWIVADLGILTAGAATTTIYPSNTADEIEFILRDSGSRIVIAETAAHVSAIESVREGAPELEHVVAIEDGGTDGEVRTTLSGLGELGPDVNVAERVDQLGPDSLATLIYTSGTTGRPKGVELTHENWLYTVSAVGELDLIHIDDVHFLWLPLSHSFGKVLEVLMVDVGCETFIDGRPDRIVDNLARSRPTVMAAAPRIFEKVYNVIVSGVKADGGLKEPIFRWAAAVGIRRSRLVRSGASLPISLTLQHAVADRLVFSKIRDRFGGRIRFFVSGSAPLSLELAEFFDGAGLTILEGYGLTESSASTFVNLPTRPRFGTVGPPVPGTQVRIAADGEVLISGQGVMRGYFGLPEETADTLIDGWLHTGDIGELDAEGYLRITDRKKELIKTSGGKYVAPAKVEGLLKVASPYISNVVVHGDRRKYCTALVTLDPDTAATWSATEGVDLEAVASHPKMRALIDQAVASVNAELASYESIKRVEILPEDFTVESGELTPSMKVKRKVVTERYMDVLDSMYDDAIDSI
jgi:long-chain acyl-CoA synthetase